MSFLVLLINDERHIVIWKYIVSWMSQILRFIFLSFSIYEFFIICFILCKILLLRIKCFVFVSTNQRNMRDLVYIILHFLITTKAQISCFHNIFWSSKRYVTINQHQIKSSTKEIKHKNNLRIFTFLLHTKVFNTVQKVKEKFTYFHSFSLLWILKKTALCWRFL